MIKNKRGNWLLCAFVSSLSTIRICRRLAVSKPFLTLLPDLLCWSIGRTRLIKPWLELEWNEWGIASGSKFTVVMKNLVIKIILMQYLLKSKLSQNPWWKISIFLIKTGSKSLLASVGHTHSPQLTLIPALDKSKLNCPISSLREGLLSKESSTSFSLLWEKGFYWGERRGNNFLFKNFKIILFSAQFLITCSWSGASLWVCQVKWHIG